MFQSFAWIELHVVLIIILLFYKLYSCYVRIQWCLSRTGEYLTQSFHYRGFANVRA